MAESLHSKLTNFIQTLDKRFGKVEPPAFLPPPSSADTDAALEVATTNSQIVAAGILGLHGPPHEGAEAAKRLMAHYVDWNEVRVAVPKALGNVLSPLPRPMERGLLFQKFLEGFFLRQRNMNLEHLVDMKPPERRQFLANLEVFSRDELPALLLTTFGHKCFPPSEDLHRVASRCGLLKHKTVLQMPKEFEDCLDACGLLSLYSHLYSIANKHCHIEKPDCAHCPLKPRCPAARAFARAQK